MTINIIDKPLLNAEEAFKAIPLGGAVEVSYAYGTLSNTRHRLKKVSPNRYRLKKNPENDKYIIIRVA